MTNPTPEQLTEKWFVEVLGWELRHTGETEWNTLAGSSYLFAWFDADGKRMGENMSVGGTWGDMTYKPDNIKPHSRIEPELTIMEVGRKHIVTCGLPPLHLEYEGLGLQEKWVWPELRKIGIRSSKFIVSPGLEHLFDCHLEKEGLRNTIMSSNHPTKAIAQLTAALKH